MELTDAKAWDGWTRTEEGQEATSAIQHSYRFKIRRVAQAAKIEVEEAAKYIRRHKPKKTAGKRRDSTLILCASDFQIGKVVAVWRAGRLRMATHRRLVDRGARGCSRPLESHRQAKAHHCSPASAISWKGAGGHYPGQTY